MVLRVLSWNVHGCVGSDGRFDPDRIARVIERHRPDVALLQEVGDLRGVHPPIDQATVLAESLGMESALGITVPSEPFGFGNVTLVRPPLRPSVVEMYDLSVGTLEPRVCLCLSLGGWLRTGNVHFGLRRFERRRQLRFLLGEGGPGLHRAGAPVVLGGDFNDWPPGRVTRTLESAFADAARRTAARPAKTFPSVRPLLRLDRLYLGGAVAPVACDVDLSEAARRASDHLPLWAELELADAANIHA